MFYKDNCKDKNNKKDFNFNAFSKYMKKSNLSVPDYNFLTWFVGFTEGDGSFVMIKRDKAQIFNVTQSIHDKQVLYKIQSKLGFGTVLEEPRGAMARFIVQDKVNLMRIALLFNGNLVLPTKQKQFKEWLSWGPNLPMVPKLSLGCLSLENAWLSGFTDAEGCFTASLSEKSNHIRLNFTLHQNGEENKQTLEKLVNLFSAGSINRDKRAKAHYYYRIMGIKNCYNLYPYFNTYTLLTKKQTVITSGKRCTRPLKANCILFQRKEKS